MNFNEQLLVLQQQYLRGLPSTLERVSRLSETLSSSQPVKHELTLLNELLHKLSGSAGTFGLSALSDHAADLERRLETFASGALEPSLRTGVALQLQSEMQTLTRFLMSDHLPVMQSFIESAETGPALSAEVWLLEDDDLLGCSLIAHLEAFNFKARLFTSFAELAEAFAREQPEVLVLDIMLGPEGRSLDCLQSSELFRNARSRLIFISATDDFNSRLQAASLGAEGFFIKPLDVPRLITRIEQVLSRLHAPMERVLIVDDDELLALYYQQLMLRAGMQADILRNPSSIIEYLEQKRPDIVLMDLQMPGINGQNLAAVIRQYDHLVGLPIVYLSAEHDPHLQLKALNQGADDFLTKPVSDDHLVTLVKSKVVRSRQLLELMTKDSLTGLLKHAAIKDAVKRESSMAKRKGETLCVAMLDIEHFKRVNDRFGHAVGDEVISSVATLLRQRLRGTDILGRYGGEEFAAVMPNCNAESATKVLDDFRQRFADVQFVAHGERFGVTISIGLVEFGDGAEIDADALLVYADKALYEAKSAGRNRLVLSSGHSAH